VSRALDTGTISSRVIVRVIDYVAARGHEPESLCRSVGVSLTELRDPDARLPYPLAERLAMHAAEVAGDPNIGLHLAHDVRDPRIFDAGLLLMMASPTLAASFDLMQRYQRLWADGERVALQPTPAGLLARFTAQGSPGEFQRQCDESAMAEMVIGARMLTGCELAPLRVAFRHAAPPETREHAELFRCSPEWGARYTELELAREDLERTLPHASETYRAIFQEQVECALARLPAPSGGVTESVRAAARAALTSGDCSLASTARALGTSARTLQRRLQAEGTSFAELVDALRCELAKLYLDRRVPVAEIAWLLGYAEASAFHHAFKRWTGSTPEQLRAARQVGD
jgi:AraC-like DNA-binding protein